MRRAGVGAEHQEQVGKIRHRQAEIGRGVIVGPRIRKGLAVTAGDVELRRHLADLEPRRDHNHIRRMQLAIGADDAIACDVIDIFGDEFDVGFAQRAEPVVVEQDAFAVRRVGRHTLRDQVGTAFQFGQDEIRQLFAMPIVAGIDGAVGIRPVRVLAQERQQAVAVAPEHVEAIPFRVIRHVRQQPLRTVGYPVRIAGDRPRPLRGSLIDRDGRNFIGDVRHELHGGRTGSDHRHALALEIEPLRPARRMKYLAREILGAFEVGHGGIVQLADGADEDGRGYFLRPIRRFKRRDPAFCRLVPVRRGQAGVEPDVFANAELVGNVLQVIEDFLLLREISGPAVTRAEGIGIGVVWRIDAAARIAIDVPGAADLVFLVDDGVGNAEPVQRDAECNRANASTDDQDMAILKFLRGRLRGPFCVALDEPHFLADHRRVFGRDLFTQRRAHHALHQVVARIGDDRLRIAAQDFDGRFPDFCLNRFRQAGARIGNQAHIAPGQVGRLHPAHVAGHVNENHQQYADVGLFNG